MRIYLAGPMRGKPLFNFPAFDEAADHLRRAGHDVFNPADRDRDAGFDPSRSIEEQRFSVADAMRADVTWIVNRAQAVAVLPGWQDSTGASLEVSLARYLGLPILDAETLEPFSETILEEAARIVDGPRRASYGHPKENHGRTAGMWSAFLGVPVTDSDVCWMMILQKASRDKKCPKRDNAVDAAGYARNLELLRG